MVHSTISATFGKETPVLVGGVARSTSSKKQTSGKSKREKRNEREEKVRKTRKRKKERNKRRLKTRSNREIA